MRKMGAEWLIHRIGRHRTTGQRMCHRKIQPPAGYSQKLANPSQHQTAMASIRISFPEKNEPSVVALTGARITIGRLPFNTLQIIDRTMSAFHAELILEDGHYRLHDRGSTNGTFVNGEPATDFHLREACKISFGTVECDYNPAAESEASAEAVPTRGEINSVRQENVELRGTLAVVREELAALLEAKPVEDAAQAVSREEFTKVVTEREALKETQLRHEQEIARLKGDSAVLRRDRENLQKAWDATKAELTKQYRPVEAVAVVEVAAAVPAPVVEALKSQPAVKPEIEVKPAAAVERPSALTAPSSPAPVSTPSVPTAPPAPLSRPAMPTAKPLPPLAPPTGRPFPAPKPAIAPAKLSSAPTVVANSSGVRPFPKAAPTAGPAAPTTVVVPASALPKSGSGVMQPRTSVMPVHARAVGPKGTQKIG